MEMCEMWSLAEPPVISITRLKEGVSKVFVGQRGTLAEQLDISRLSIDEIIQKGSIVLNNIRYTLNQP